MVKWSTQRQRRPKLQVQPVGSPAVAKLVGRAIGKVLSLARQRDLTRAKRQSNPTATKEAARLWYESNKAVVLKKNKHWKQTNKKNVNETRVKYLHRVLKHNPAFVAAQRCRFRLRNILRAKKASKQCSTLDSIGCNKSELVEHLGIQNGIPAGMEIDHVFPLSRYDWDDPATQTRAMHYSNLQLLKRTDNCKKYNHLPSKAVALRVARWAWPTGITEQDLLY